MEKAENQIGWCRICDTDQTLITCGVGSDWPMCEWCATIGAYDGGSIETLKINSNIGRLSRGLQLLFSKITTNHTSPPQQAAE